MSNDTNEDNQSPDASSEALRISLKALKPHRDEQLPLGDLLSYAEVEAIMQLFQAHIATVELEARQDELALFARTFIKEESIGSTPSDLITAEPYIEADTDEIIAHVDTRLEQLEDQKGKQTHE